MCLVILPRISIFQTPKHSKVLQEFYKKLQDSGKANLLALHRASLRDPNFDFVRLLYDLGNEQMFEVTYVDIEEKSSSGDHQCLVQLSTLPVAVCYGIGRDQACANNNAAKNALNYLKLMTKKSVASSADNNAAAKKSPMAAAAKQSSSNNVNKKSTTNGN